MSQLSEKLKEKAKNELGETEARKLQSLELFRDWLKKHPFIESSEHEDFDIIPFLRSKKFSMQKSCEAFEEVAIFRDKYKEILEIEESKVKELLKYLELSTVKITKIQNETDLRNVFVFTKNFTQTDISGEDFMRIFYIVNSMLYYEVKTQINGFNLIIDCREIGMSFIKRFPIKIMHDGIKILSSFPFRVKSIIFIGVPAFAVAIYEAIFAMASSKIKKRIKLISDVMDLKNYFDISSLCENYGGNDSNCESVDDLKELIIEGFQKVAKFTKKSKINHKKYREFKGDEISSIESFRHLEEID
ncbi:hypothetical protein PVAND_006370 [Polypedilum vanderplanki]|uniref:CRAL-TRIO domain-containing protein n=1 Tax=Polypedilum vanderplanki TaxID=319348 RepID=A0A9J6C302_POLVA|nr:hypothetical protein PVAND_006370 [Polypedilum vanderplanki]